MCAYENKKLSNLGMNNHMKGSGYTCREVMGAYSSTKKTKKFHKLFQQQLQLSKRCNDKKN
jgi:hypothetical protein